MSDTTITPEVLAEAEKKISDLAELHKNYRSYLSKLCYVWNDDTYRTICVVMGVTVGNTESVFSDSPTADARTYKYAHPLTMEDAESLIIKHNTSVWDAELIDQIDGLYSALEAAEARAEKAAKYAGECAIRALDKAAQLESMRTKLTAVESRASGAEIRAEKAEAALAQLRAERDWLAKKVGDASYGKPCDKDINFTSGDCPMGHLWGDDCCIHTDKPTCWAAEAARRAVAAESEVRE